jgi:hypothetical protein
MIHPRPRLHHVCSLLCALGCDVYPIGSGPSGIANLDSLPEDGCSRGFLVVSSDYQSINVSAFDRQGNLLSPSIVSSGLSPAGLAQAFSGDVVFPSERQRGTEAILIDRYPQSVLSFVDLGSAVIRAQLDVSTGFAANPHDALRLDDGRLLLTRFDSNADPGASPDDAGGDLLLLDASYPRIVSRIDPRVATPKATEVYLPHPDRMLRVQQRIFVVVSLYSADYRRTSASYLLSLGATTLDITDSLELPEVAGCSGLSVSPDESELAIACSGIWAGSTTEQLETSGLVGIDITDAPAVSWQVMANALEPAQPFGLSLAYANRGRVLAVALGRHATATERAESDRFVSYDVKTKRFDVLYRVDNNPFSLGDVRCLADCGLCGLANADGRGHLMLYQDDATRPSLVAEVITDPVFGLPPRWLGTF